MNTSRKPTAAEVLKLAEEAVATNQAFDHEMCEKLLARIYQDIVQRVKDSKKILNRDIAYTWVPKYVHPSSKIEVRVNDVFPELEGNDLVGWDGGEMTPLTEYGEYIKKDLESHDYSVSLYSGNLHIKW